MNLKCRSFYGSSDTVCSLKIVYENRAHEFGGTQGETEKEQEFLSTIFAFITLETTKVMKRILPGTEHLLSYVHPCDSKVASICFTNYQISFFSNQNGDTKSFLQSPLIFYKMQNSFFAQNKMWHLTADIMTANCTKCGPNCASKKFNLHSKMGRIVVFRGNVDTK